jgi:muramidase (phage lysozyme)
MDRTVPPGAAYLLDWISHVETGWRDGNKGYDTIFGHRQKNLAALKTRPITKRTVDEWIATMPWWGGKSSASGRYQFMKATLRDLKTQLGLRGAQVMDENLQDRLGYHLLRRRGYDKWIAGQMSDVDFSTNLAKEWASLPVLKAMKGHHRTITRGQSYYVGDALNKSLVKPEKFEQALREARVASRTPRKEPDVAPAPTPITPTPVSPAQPVIPGTDEKPAIAWYKSDTFMGAGGGSLAAALTAYLLYNPALPLRDQILGAFGAASFAAASAGWAWLKRWMSTAQLIVRSESKAQEKSQEIADERAAITVSNAATSSVDEAWGPVPAPAFVPEFDGEIDEGGSETEVEVTTKRPLKEVSLVQWSEEMPEVIAKFTGVVGAMLPMAGTFAKLAEVGRDLQTVADAVQKEGRPKP